MKEKNLHIMSKYKRIFKQQMVQKLTVCTHHNIKDKRRFVNDEINSHRISGCNNKYL